MFPHLLFGSLVFLFFGRCLNFQLSAGFLLIGAFFGILPDLCKIGKPVFNKWSHKHRDGTCHSIFFPVILFTILSFYDFRFAILAAFASLTHPFVDLYGIGWGVKLFYPFSQKTYKAFYKGKIIYVFQNENELKTEVQKNGMDDWVKKVYFTWNWVGAYEWASLIIFILLLILASFGLFT